jgi:superfamily II DNA or RNA helicase/diadenosine tetraphosphate (Ap4A) HIT family hydrolase/HKD family nuclease
MPTTCPFCQPDPGRVFYENERVVGLWDAFPVSPGHALLVPKRHIAGWFDASADERQALADAIAVARDAIVRRYRPDGFNIGANVGEAAGQTVFHLHVHVIPRYLGDVPDPRGGVRYVVPAKANYLAGEAVSATMTPKPHLLVVGGVADPLLRHLAQELADADSLDVAVAFVLPAGVQCLAPHLEDLLARGGRLRLVTGDYRDVTDPNALLQLMDLSGDASFRVFESGGPSPRVPFERAFHPKAYLLRRRDGTGVAFVGSSNLSHSALTTSVEWNYRVVSSRDAEGWASVQNAFEELWGGPGTRPLTHQWIDDYRARRLLEAEGRALPVEVAPEPLPPLVPHDVQEEALAALEGTRAQGYRAGLVVLATGLGKTWLSAFDSARPQFRRVLFVAHREEILAQALSTFRRIRPSASLGLYNSEEKSEQAEVLFASIQTLGRNEHLQRFSPNAFDYIVVDEFHHAAAQSYRRLIEYFSPKFLLGLTATPERTDGGDLLALCQENLVYRCDLTEGIRRQLLCPFRYVGVPDAVDYSNIPWRSSRFDEEALTEAVATRERAQNALEQWLKHAGPGTRTLAFCVSQRHADFMARFLVEHGARAVAVHAGSTSAPRALSLERLSAQELDIVCAVDMFNEGVDLPSLDAVLMLRPTESRIVWLQQFGRGLRVAEGKSHLRVVDYIGNHRVFLLKPQTLFDLPAGRQNVFNCLEKLEAGEWPLPPGCDVTYELEAIEILKKLSQGRGLPDALRGYYENFRETCGERPTASEAHHDGYKPRSVRQAHGSWLGFVRDMGDLSGPGEAAFDSYRGFLSALEITEMTRSFKMLVLKAMLDADALPGRLQVDVLTARVRELARRTPRLASEFGSALEDESKLRQLLERNPIDAWTGGRGTGNVTYFAYADGVFSTTFDVALEQRTAFQELARELIQWRLDEYLDRPHPASAGSDQFTCPVSHAHGRPLVFLPDRRQHVDVPLGPTELHIDGRVHHADFVKVALNVVREQAGGPNVLPAILRRWFGPDAGLPGTRHTALLQRQGDSWYLFPGSRRRDQVNLWQTYSREEIPALFGMEFSPAIWNVGYVARSGHIFLLVTLDKSGHSQEFQYGDRFLSPSLFRWQSQNRTTQDGADGQRLRHHHEQGYAVHLFVRPAKRSPGGGAAPFVCCGNVDFVDCEGSRPITSRWRLRETVPERLRTMLRVPER